MTGTIRYRRHLRILCGIVLAFALAAAGLVSTPDSGHAAKKKKAATPVSISAPSEVQLPSDAAITGVVGGKSQGATVMLLQLAGGDWRVVQTSQVSAAKTYVFRAPVAVGANHFQVRAKKSKKLKRAGASAPVVVTGVGDPGAQAVPPELASVRSRILNDTNAFRALKGLPMLQPMAGLDTVAQNWTQYMASTGSFRHNPNFFAQYPGTPWAGAENIAAGFAPESVVAAWIGSAAHLAALIGNYTHIGIGYARSASGTPYFTQNFARY